VSPIRQWNLNLVILIDNIFIDQWCSLKTLKKHWYFVFSRKVYVFTHVITNPLYIYIYILICFFFNATVSLNIHRNLYELFWLINFWATNNVREKLDLNLWLAVLSGGIVSVFSRLIVNFYVIIDCFCYQFCIYNC
jgi:hypothetical protein